MNYYCVCLCCMRYPSYQCVQTLLTLLIRLGWRLQLSACCGAFLWPTVGGKIDLTMHTTHTFLWVTLVQACLLCGRCVFQSHAQRQDHLLWMSRTSCRSGHGGGMSSGADGSSLSAANLMLGHNSNAKVLALVRTDRLLSLMYSTWP